MTTSSSPAYPAEEDVDVVLRDGSTLRVRPVRASDRAGIERFLAGLSQESRVFRFFSIVKDLAAIAERAVDVDYRDRHGLVALHGDEVVGHGFYVIVRPGRAEMAIAIADVYQGRGLGTILLGRLAAYAVAAGISEFTAEVMTSNIRMLEVLRESGFPIQSRSEYGVVIVDFPTSLTDEARDRFERREQLAAQAALHRFFEPRSVAVIGATSRRGTIGGEVFHNLLGSGFPGPVYPVSPHPVVQSVLAYPDVRAIAGPVDLAVIVVPAAGVAEVARACAVKGVGALVVISAGFAEVGGAGARRQAELVEICRAAGMRLIGPNCMGILSTVEGRTLDATFAPHSPSPGRIGFMSQSGALGLAVIEEARQTGLGISEFISVGNKADVSGNDLLEFWEDDPATDVIVLYLESFGNPRRFSRIARRVGRKKPILAVKGGRTAAGARAASSHTGAMLAASDITVDALFAGSGVIRADTLGELFDVARLLTGTWPRSRRVGIVTNAGGLGILCADACAAAGLEVPVLSTRTQATLGEFLPETAAPGNPVDMIAGAGATAYAQAIGAVAGSGEVDAVIAIFIPPLAGDASGVSAAVGQAASGVSGEVPVLAVMTGGDQVPPPPGVPCFRFPEEAARALGKVAAWMEWRARPERPAWLPADVDADRAKGIVATALAGGRGWLDPDETLALLSCYRIPVVESRAVATEEAAAAAASALGGPVVLKGTGPDLLHKSDVGAVALDLRDGEAVLAAARAMRARVEAAGRTLTGFTVQPFVADGVEMLVGVASDQVFGPILACGAGGATTELLRDVRFALPPLAEADADELLRSLGTFPLLTGYRGRPSVDVRALRDLVLRVGAMADDLPEITELDLNPVLVVPDGAVVVDARVRVEIASRRLLDGARPHVTGA